MSAPRDPAPAAVMLTDDEREALVDERNHWIGEAKRYEGLYRHESKWGRCWFKRMKVAEAEVAALRGQVEAVRALADEISAADDPARHDREHLFGRWIIAQLTIALDAEAVDRG